MDRECHLNLISKDVKHLLFTQIKIRIRTFCFLSSFFAGCNLKIINDRIAKMHYLARVFKRVNDVSYHPHPGLPACDRVSVPNTRSHVREFGKGGTKRHFPVQAQSIKGRKVKR